jgi:hypothetical protein
MKEGRKEYEGRNMKKGRKEYEGRKMKKGRKLTKEGRKE